MIITLLAQTNPAPTGPEFGKASPLGLVIVLLLLVGTVLLVWNMNKHIKKLPATFSPEHPEPDQAADEGTDPGVVQPEAEDAAAEPSERSLKKNESSGAS
ncbi:hypothetical protein HLB23_08700 [Nocardia uniformis]|uniref:Uncharacterized protein n=1 Tax=Nocardia uniformis TaxID=53432 RepID=A0A849C0B7_9NOCA|nr:hypothetical protein [Nocardia uniformis]NNH69940.1 hypothetical protein [Nocardia uniformis]